MMTCELYTTGNYVRQNVLIECNSYYPHVSRKTSELENTRHDAPANSYTGILPVTRPVSPILLPEPGISPAIPPVRPLADLLKVLFVPRPTEDRAPP